VIDIFSLIHQVPDNVEYHGISITERSDLRNNNTANYFDLKTIVLAKNFHSLEILWTFVYETNKIDSYRVLHMYA
jgi:hypothetical protein